MGYLIGSYQNSVTVASNKKKYLINYTGYLNDTIDIWDDRDFIAYCEANGFTTTISDCVYNAITSLIEIKEATGSNQTWESAEDVWNITEFNFNG